MSEAKLGHRKEADAALANYRRLWVAANPKATTPPPLEEEAEKVVAESPETPNSSRGKR